MEKHKKIYLYPIIMESHKEGGYHAKCPILQGAWADGRTIKEATKNLKDIIKSILKYREEREKKNFIIPGFAFEKAKILKDLNIAVTV